jgi:hypothetical protein
MFVELANQSSVYVLKKVFYFSDIWIEKKFVFYKLRWDSLFCDYGTFYNMHKFHELMLIEELTHLQSLNFGCFEILYFTVYVCATATHFYIQR